MGWECVHGCADYATDLLHALNQLHGVFIHESPLDVFSVVLLIPHAFPQTCARSMKNELDSSYPWDNTNYNRYVEASELWKFFQVGDTVSFSQMNVHVTSPWVCIAHQLVHQSGPSHAFGTSIAVIFLAMFTAEYTGWFHYSSSGSNSVMLQLLHTLYTAAELASCHQLLCCYALMSGKHAYGHLS